MHWDIISKNLGLAERSVVRQGFDALLAAFGLGSAPSTPLHPGATFTIAFIALAAKMAKADGCVSPIEAATFAQLYHVRPDEEANVKRVFDLASGDTAGFEVYARQIARALSHDPRLVRDVFDGLFHIAAADGVLHPGEDAFLSQVAEIFAISTNEYAAIRSTFVVDSRSPAGAYRPGPSSPYQVLGLDPGVSDAELKAHYRALVREYHPDGLAARGVPPEFFAASERKLAVINAAYDVIIKQRNLQHAALQDALTP